MKFGMRKPSLKRSISARTTGKAKRAVKKAVVPGYGKKGSGWLKNPKKAAYNKVYRKTTFGLGQPLLLSARREEQGRPRRHSIDVHGGPFPPRR